MMAGFSNRTYLLIMVLTWWMICSACEPPRSYRLPVPPSASRLPPRPAPPPAPASPPPAPPESARKPLPPEDRIREQDLKGTLPAPLPGSQAKETPQSPSDEENRSTPEATAPAPLPDDSSLLAKITPGISPQRAASLRLTEEGKKFLDAGEPAKALTRLEKTIVIDSTNPYGYFYLAKAQYQLGRYRESLNFLEIAESRLGNEPFWLAEIHALRGENYRALGQFSKAEASYQQAVRLNSGNRTATDGLAHLQPDIPAVGK